MRRTVGRLAQKQVINAKPPKGRSAVLVSDGGNLYLQCTLADDGSVRRSWVFRYEARGQRHELGLGPLYTVGLAEARERARSLRLQILDGIDPLEARRAAERERLQQKAAQAKVVTFRQCAEMYLDAHADRWKNPKHRTQWRSTLEAYIHPLLGDLDVNDIDESHLVKVLQPLWKRIPTTASRLRARIENVLGFAIASQFRRNNNNPARGHRHLNTLLGGAKKDVAHHAALPYLDAPAFMVELRRQSTLVARALEFTILTAARTGEVRGACWSEINLKTCEWIVPASRMKTGVEHRVPLCHRAVEILKALPQRWPHVFAGASGKPLADRAMLDLLQGMRPGATVHGFRSVFADWAHEGSTRTHANHVIELSLAHAVGSAIEKAYRRGDMLEKRRRLMEDWGRFLASPLPAGATVTPLRKVAADP